MTTSYSIQSRESERKRLERIYVTKPFQAFQCQSSIQFYNRHSLLCLVFSKFKFNFISIFTTWQAVHLYTQNAVLLVGSISQTLRINHTFGYIINNINFFLSIYFTIFLFLSHVLLLLPRLFSQHPLMVIVLQMNM